MSKRVQEREMEGEPAVVEPRPTCLISTNLNRVQSSSFGPDASNVPGNPQLDSGSGQRSCEKLQQRVLKCGKRTNRLQGVVGNSSEEICVGVQGVA